MKAQPITTKLVSTLGDNIYYNALGERFFCRKEIELPCYAIISDDVIVLKMMEEIIPNEPLVECDAAMYKITETFGNLEDVIEALEKELEELMEKQRVG